MSIVSLGLQCVGIMRKEGSNNFERSVKNAHNLEEVHKATSKSKEEVKECLRKCSHQHFWRDKHWRAPSYGRLHCNISLSKLSV